MTGHGRCKRGLTGPLTGHATMYHGSSAEALVLLLLLLVLLLHKVHVPGHLCEVGLLCVVGRERKEPWRSSCMLVLPKAHLEHQERKEAR